MGSNYLIKNMKKTVVGTVLLLLCALFVGSLVVFTQDFTYPNKNESSQENAYNTGVCHMPKVLLRNDAFTKLKRSPTEDNCTANTAQLSYLTDDEKLLLFKSDGNGCCLREIERPPDVAGDKYKTSAKCTPFQNNTSVSDKQLFVVECPMADKTGLQYNFHATLFQNSTVPAKVAYWNNHTKIEDRPPSVMIIVLDSVTRNDAFRDLYQTVNYVTKKHNFVEFHRHHILGETSFQNMLPLLLGTSAHDLWWKVNKEWKAPWDTYPFIWSNYSAENYVTFFSEDGRGTFNYGGQRGFTKQPTDYYLRPLYDAHQETDFVSMADEKKNCFGVETKTEFSLNYLKRFILKMKEIPTFSLTRLSFPHKHNKEQSIYQFDDIFLKFFQSIMETKSICENTVILFMSDHGFTENAYASTIEGWVERRLPLLLFHLPLRLYAKYPDLAKNLAINSHSVTSHFDTYETLLHLARLVSAANNNTEKKRTKLTFRKSLLNPMGSVRSCDDAHIPKEICVCTLPSLPDTTETATNPLGSNNATKLFEMPNSIMDDHPMATSLDEFHNNY